MSIRSSPGKAGIVALFLTFAILFVVVFSVGVFVGKGLNKEGFRTTRSFEESPAPEAVPPPPDELAGTEPPGQSVEEVIEDIEQEAGPGAMSAEEVEEGVETVEEAPADKPVPVPDDRERRMAEVTREIEKKMKSSSEAGNKTPGEPSLPPVDPDGLYTVQIGSFQDRNQADSLAGSLRSKGYPVFIKSMTTPDKKSWHRVRVGTFRNIDTAKSYGENLKKLEPGVELVFITVNN